jgi:hypothetical protein
MLWILYGNLQNAPSGNTVFLLIDIGFRDKKLLRSQKKN